MPCSSVSVQINHVMFNSKKNCLSAILYLQFAENIRNVVLNCLLADIKVFGDLLVAVSLGD